jgi:hypothetical protein
MAMRLNDYSASGETNGTITMPKLISPGSLMSNPVFRFRRGAKKLEKDHGRSL